MQQLFQYIQEFWGLIFGAGGLFATFLYYRQTARLKSAEAKKSEIENNKEQITFLENRLSERDKKVDALYIELRREQELKLDLIEKLGRSQLENEILKIQKCEVRGCGNRLPPSDY